MMAAQRRVVDARARGRLSMESLERAMAGEKNCHLNGGDPERVTGLPHASPMGSGPDYADLTCRGTAPCAIIVKKVTQ